jgi:hypothetical protein
MSEETTPDYGPQKRPASARQIEAQRRFLANESASGSSDASLCSGAGRKAPSDDPDVQGTVVPTGLAQAWWMALHWQCEAERLANEYRRKMSSDTAMEFRVLRDAFASIQAELNASMLNAKDETRREVGD